MSADIPEILARVEAALARAEARILDSCGLHEWDLYPEVTFGDLRKMVAALKARDTEREALMRVLEAAASPYSIQGPIDLADALDDPIIRGLLDTLPP